MGGGNERRSGHERTPRRFRSTDGRKILKPQFVSAPSRSIFQALPGAWTLRRAIEDTRFGAGSFTGTADFSPQPDGALLYEELGELTLGAWRGPAWRRWIYALEGDALVVRYPGTLAELHSFVFAAEPNGAVSARHVHLCGEDRYDARFERGADGSLHLAYAVTGPAKDYRLTTILTHA